MPSSTSVAVIDRSTVGDGNACDDSSESTMWAWFSTRLTHQLPGARA